MIDGEKNARLPLDRILRRDETGSEMGVPTAQERFSEEELYKIRHEFARRLSEAFRGDRPRDIARRLLTTDATVKPYLDGNRLPVAEMLLQIHRTSGVSLDWLLLGKGEKHTEKQKLFTDAEIEEIERRAKTNKRTFADELRQLTLAGLRAIEGYNSEL